MNRSVTISACLLWTLLLSVAAYRSWNHGSFHPDQYYLLGIPAAMIPLTLLLARYAPLERYRAAVLFVGSAIALLAGMLWFSVWGADV